MKVGHSLIDLSTVLHRVMYLSTGHLMNHMACTVRDPWYEWGASASRPVFSPRRLRSPGMRCGGDEHQLTAEVPLGSKDTAHRPIDGADLLAERPTFDWG